MNARLTEILLDLDAESVQLDSWVRDLSDGEWSTPTPAVGWTVAHQIAHLHWTDEASLAAIEGGEAWDRLVQGAVQDPTGYVDTAADRTAAAPPSELLARWRAGRTQLADALRGVPDGQKIAWYGPPMSPASMATARLMETWAHAHDVAVALGVEVPITDRVRHVCFLGVRTRAFAYLVRGLPMPDTDVYVELTGPNGETWSWGPPDAPERVTGNAWDFALVVTRRRQPDDVDVHAEGQDAQQWLSIAQAFAGLPGRDPARAAPR